MKIPPFIATLGMLYVDQRPVAGDFRAEADLFQRYPNLPQVRDGFISWVP